MDDAGTANHERGTLTVVGDRATDGNGEHDASGTVRRPAEVIRVAMVAREVLEEMRGDELNDAARDRASAVYSHSIDQLGELLSDDLRHELDHLVGDRSEHVAPSPGELRVAEAQLTGWLDGLLRSMEATMAAQALQDQAARAEALQREEAAREEARHRRDNSYL